MATILFRTPSIQPIIDIPQPPKFKKRLKTKPYIQKIAQLPAAIKEKQSYEENSAWKVLLAVGTLMTSLTWLHRESIPANSSAVAHLSTHNFYQIGTPYQNSTLIPINPPLKPKIPAVPKIEIGECEDTAQRTHLQWLVSALVVGSTFLATAMTAFITHKRPQTTNALSHSNPLYVDQSPPLAPPSQEGILDQQIAQKLEALDMQIKGIRSHLKQNESNNNNSILTDTTTSKINPLSQPAENLIPKIYLVRGNGFTAASLNAFAKALSKKTSLSFTVIAESELETRDANSEVIFTDYFEDPAKSLPKCTFAEKISPPPHTLIVYPKTSTEPKNEEWSQSVTCLVWNYDDHRRIVYTNTEKNQDVGELPLFNKEKMLLQKEEHTKLVKKTYVPINKISRKMNNNTDHSKVTDDK